MKRFLLCALALLLLCLQSCSSPTASADILKFQNSIQNVELTLTTPEGFSLLLDFRNDRITVLAPESLAALEIDCNSPAVTVGDIKIPITADNLSVKLLFDAFRLKEHELVSSGKTDGKTPTATFLSGNAEFVFIYSSEGLPLSFSVTKDSITYRANILKISYTES